MKERSAVEWRFFQKDSSGLWSTLSKEILKNFLPYFLTFCLIAYNFFSLFLKAHQHIYAVIGARSFIHSTSPAPGKCSFVTNNIFHYRTVSCKKVLGKENLRREKLDSNPRSVYAVYV